MSENVPQSERELYQAVGEIRTDIKWLISDRTTHKQHHTRIEYALYLAFIIATVGVVGGLF